MKRVFVADTLPAIRSALRLVLHDLNMLVVGEASDWDTVLAQAASTHPDLVLVEWAMIPTATGATLSDLRRTCPAAIVIVLISHLDAREQAALAAGADAFISKGETPDRVAEHLRAAAESVQPA
jgi:DNA-binding NarL/FixJ family response regulator